MVYKVNLINNNKFNKCFKFNSGYEFIYIPYHCKIKELCKN